MSFHLRLNKGLSYSGIVRATKKNPDVITDDEAVFVAALATGYFDVVDDSNPAIAEDAAEAKAEETAETETTDGKPSGKSTELSEMTVAELKQYAGIKGIPLKEKMTKEAILKAIEEAEK